MRSKTKIFIKLISFMLSLVTLFSHIAADLSLAHQHLKYEKEPPR